MKVRAVEAMNYAPQLGELITYGHSTAEVWVKGLNKWVIIDPWMGFALVDGRGQLLSADDLANLPDEAEIHQLPILGTIRRFEIKATAPDTKSRLIRMMSR